MKSAKMPMALDPPPTQASTASGRVPLEHRARLGRDHALELPHDLREGVGATHGADQVVGRVDRGDPVAHGLVHGVLERARARAHRDDLGAEQLHASHVEGLSPGVDLAHVDGALQAEQGRGGRGGDTVLARARLGDHPSLAHADGEQRLAEHVVDLVRARVVEVPRLSTTLALPQ
jgi:hypothetical protein